MKLSIIGTRGIPASYSGFETSVEETAIRFVKKNINTTVYCRKNHYKEINSEYHHVKLVHLPSIKTKHLDTITHTFLSVIHCLKQDNDFIQLYGVGNAVFIPLLKLSGVKIISIVDGADWERKKWGWIAKMFLKFCRKLTVQFSDYYVVDSEVLVDEYKNKFIRPPVYIPYGAVISNNFDKNVLKKYNLTDSRYIIFIGRFVKEKGIEFLIKHYCSIKTNIKLVVVGGNSIDRGYENKIKSMGNNNVIFTGFLYGKEYESLLRYSIFYVSCSFLEGTSPSLLSAMAINGYALVSNLIENKEVLKGSCDTFKVGDSKDFIIKLQSLINKKHLDRKKTFRIVNKYYNWDTITDQYCKLMIK